MQHREFVYLPTRLTKTAREAWSVPQPTMPAKSATLRGMGSELSTLLGSLERSRDGDESLTCGDVAR